MVTYLAAHPRDKRERDREREKRLVSPPDGDTMEQEEASASRLSASLGT